MYAPSVGDKSMRSTHYNTYSGIVLRIEGNLLLVASRSTAFAMATVTQLHIQTNVGFRSICSKSTLSDVGCQPRLSPPTKYIMNSIYRGLYVVMTPSKRDRARILAFGQGRGRSCAGKHVRDQFFLYVATRLYCN